MSSHESVYHDPDAAFDEQHEVERLHQQVRNSLVEDVPARDYDRGVVDKLDRLMDAVRADERDRVTDRLDNWGDEVQDFYPEGNYYERQAVKDALHRASRRIYYGRDGAS